MTTPNLGQFTVHSAGKVTGATGALADPVNTVDITRTGAGIYVINLGSDIDNTVRHTSLTPLSGVGSHLELNPAVQTDSTIGVLAFTNGGVAADVDFSYLVTRTKI